MAILLRERHTRFEKVDDLSVRRPFRGHAPGPRKLQSAHAGPLPGRFSALRHLRSALIRNKQALAFIHMLGAVVAAHALAKRAYRREREDVWQALVHVKIMF